MNLLTGDLPDRLAAEYVLGTLTGGARRRFDTLLLAHPTLRRAVAGWEARLLPMALKAEPVTPPPAVWQALESRLGWAEPAAMAAKSWAKGSTTSAAPGARVPSMRALRLWQAFGVAASVVALVLGTAPRRAPMAAPMVIVLHATQGSEALVAALSQDRRQMSIQPVQKVALAQTQSLELWALPKSGAPTSLGVISADGLTALPRKDLPAGTQGLAVSREPLGGSPTGKPTGPVLFVGDLTL